MPQRPIYFHRVRFVLLGAENLVANGKLKGVLNNGQSFISAIGKRVKNYGNYYLIKVKVIKMQKECQIQNHKCINHKSSCPCQTGQLTKKFISSNDSKSNDMVDIKMSQKAYRKMMNCICPRPAESGGILLGPVGSNMVTDFYFDSGGTCTGSSYSPDHVTLSKLMKEKWLPSGIDMKGFLHSHPGQLDWLTYGDMAYINRLLDKNPDMDMFIAPIVIPNQFRIRPIVVLRKQPRVALEAKIDLF